MHGISVDIPCNEYALPFFPLKCMEYQCASMRICMEDDLPMDIPKIVHGNANDIHGSSMD